MEHLCLIHVEIFHIIKQNVLFIWQKITFNRKMSNGYDKFQLNRDVRNSSQTGNTDEFFGKKKI